MLKNFWLEMFRVDESVREIIILTFFVYAAMC